MMRVEWQKQALDELAQIWTGSDSALRSALVDAANDIDRELLAAPETAGESRPGERRVLFAWPLGVAFKHDQAAQVVTVLHVWDIRRDK